MPAIFPAGPEITVNANPSIPFGNPASIVHLPGGGFIIFWSEALARDGSGGCIQARIFDANNVPVGTEFVVNTTTAGTQALPHATLLTDGTIMVTWQDGSLAGGDASSNSIKGQILSATGAKIGGEFLVNTTTAGSQSGPTSTLMDNGNVLILWTDASATGGDTSGQAIRAQIVTAAGVKVGGEFLVNTQTIGNQAQVQVAKLAGGNIIVTWFDANGDDSGGGVKGQILDPSGAAIGGEFLVNSQTAGLQSLPDVAALANGTFVVTWQDASGTLGDADGTSIKAQLFDSTGQKIGGEFLVNTGTVYSQTNPSVALLSDGKFAIAWRDAGPNTGTPAQSLHAQVFNADGTRVGTAFIADTPVDALIEGSPAIADLGDGQFIVASSSSLLVNNVQQSRGLHAQIFNLLNQVIGTADGDDLSGTAAADFIDGLAGRDLIHGLGGNDVIDAGDGDDVVFGEDGDDAIAGGDGDDTVYGENGNDAIAGGAGADTIYGGNGDDTIDGGDGDDVIDGGIGNNMIFGGDGNDVIDSTYASGQIDGEGGDDRITVTNAISGSINGGDGDDRIVLNGGTGVIAIDGGGGRNTITASVASNATLFVDTQLGGGSTISIGTGRSHIALGANDVLTFTGAHDANIFGIVGRQVIIPGSGGGSIRMDFGFHAGEAGDTIDLSVFGADPFGPGGPLIIQLSTSTTPGATLITNTLTGLTIRLGGVDPRNLSSYNLGGVNNPLFNPQGLTLDGAFATQPTVEFPDELVGADGNDVLRSYGGDDTLFGAGGNDRLDGGLGADTMDGGTGNDIFVVDNSGDVVIERASGGNDTIEIAQSADLANYANIENITLTGTADLSATGNSGVNILTGNSGNNLLDGGTGADTLFGGAGDDAFIVDDAGDVVIELAGEGYDEIRTSVSGYVLPANVEKLIYTGAGGVIIGNAGHNNLTGGAGADLFRLEDGGADAANGGGGDDGFYFGGAMDGVDLVDGGAGNDQLALQGVYGGLIFNPFGLTNVEMVVLLAGTDTRFANLGGALMSYTLTTVDANVAAGQLLTFQANTLRAGESFTLNAAAETDGSILTFGGFGTENITGGQRDDGFYFGTGRFGAADRVDGQGGSDQLGLQGDYAGANALTLGANQLAGVEFIVLMSASDTRFGGGTAGQSFGYTLTTNDGNVAAGQSIVISATTLRATEMLTFDGSAEADGSFRVFSGAAADTIIGGSLADEIWGGAGVDRVEGRGGADVLRGGADADLFIYRAISDSTAAARDRIMDFASGDLIDLSAVDANSVAGGQQSFQLIGSGQAFTAAGQLRITQTGTSALVEADSDGDGIADFALEVTLTGGHTLTRSDILGLAPAAETIKRGVFGALDQAGPDDALLWNPQRDSFHELHAQPTVDLMI